MPELVHTTCNRDCPDSCGIVAEVEEGRVVRLRGDKHHPVTRGFLCARTNRFPERAYGPERITQPLLRRPDGTQVAIQFDEAIALAAEKLREVKVESGPEAIFHYRSGGSLGHVKHVVELFFNVLGPVTAKRGDICSGAGEQAQIIDFGQSESHDLFDLHHARHIVNWGKNLHVSNVHLLPVVREARRRGASYTVIDPVHSQTAADADRHLQVRPGGDIALAQAVGRVLFATDRVAPGAAARCVNLEEFRELCFARRLEELCFESDCTVDEVRRLADLLADGPTAILVGWGLQRRLRGSSTVRMLDALGAISGNLGVRGGGVSFYYGRRRGFDLEQFRTAPPPRRISEPLMGRELAAADPPVRAMWVTAGNPVAMLPDSRAVARAFEQVEFTVVVDAFHTDTTRRASLVLPCTTLLEDDDVHGAYGHHWLGVSRPVVPPPGEARTDLAIIHGAAAAHRRRGRHGARVEGTVAAPPGAARGDRGDAGGGLRPQPPGGRGALRRRQADADAHRTHQLDRQPARSRAGGGGRQRRGVPALAAFQLHA
jgi:anaerobic selenocysteine-containing dehydrogenase